MSEFFFFYSIFWHMFLDKIFVFLLTFFTILFMSKIFLNIYTIKFFFLKLYNQTKKLSFFLLYNQKNYLNRVFQFLSKEQKKFSFSLWN